MQVNLYIETEKKGIRRQRRKYGYVLECELRGNTETRTGFDEIETTQHGAVVTAIEKALIRVTKPSEITIFAPDQWVLSMLTVQMEKWAAADFLNAKGEPIAQQKEWMHIWLLAKQHEIKAKCGKHAYTGWLQNLISEAQ